LPLFYFQQVNVEDAALRRFPAQPVNQSLMGNRERYFDAILIDDPSRLTRKLADALNLYERLTFAGNRLVAVSQGVDSESSQTEILFGVHGLLDSVYSRELGLKTHLGLQGCALKALHTGGRVFSCRQRSTLGKGNAHEEGLVPKSSANRVE
jgi:DNA invertase Pin-like site-specific DNA recombinase